MSKIAIVGLQHQGIVQAACFADMGHYVLAISDNLRQTVDLNNGRSRLNEPGLDDMLLKNLSARRLEFTTDMDELSSEDFEFVFLSIDLPFDKKGLIMDSALAIATEVERLRPARSSLCVCSQVPVGTTETLTKSYPAYLPELLRPGQSLENFMNPDRIIIGSDSPYVLEHVSSLYRVLNRPIVTMGLRSAEMSKHAHNTMLATQISFANEIANLCEKLGADAKDVALATKLDSRVGEKSYVNPGWGLSGGHLIRDLHVLQALGRDHGVATPLLDAVELVDKKREEAL